MQYSETRWRRGDTYKRQKQYTAKYLQSYITANRNVIYNYIYHYWLTLHFFHHHKVFLLILLEWSNKTFFYWQDHLLTWARDTPRLICTPVRCKQALTVADGRRHAISYTCKSSEQKHLWWPTERKGKNVHEDHNFHFLTHRRAWVRLILCLGQ